MQFVHDSGNFQQCYFSKICLLVLYWLLFFPLMKKMLVILESLCRHADYFCNFFLCDSGNFASVISQCFAICFSFQPLFWLLKLFIEAFLVEPLFFNPVFSSQPPPVQKDFESLFFISKKYEYNPYLQHLWFGYLSFRIQP